MAADDLTDLDGPAKVLARAKGGCWFNAPKVEDAGLLALSYYHERIDEERNVGLGAEHDWSSHCADAFGLMAVAYEKQIREQHQRPASFEMVRRV